MFQNGSQLRIWFERQNLIVQNLVYKESSASLNYKQIYNTSISNIPTYGLKLSSKSSNMFRLYCKNMNGFNTDKKPRSSYISTKF